MLLTKNQLASFLLRNDTQQIEEALEKDKHAFHENLIKEQQLFQYISNTEFGWTLYVTDYGKITDNSNYHYHRKPKEYLWKCIYSYSNPPQLYPEAPDNATLEQLLTFLIQLMDDYPIMIRLFKFKYNSDRLPMESYGPIMIILPDQAWFPYYVNTLVDPLRPWHPQDYLVVQHVVLPYLKKGGYYMWRFDGIFDPLSIYQEMIANQKISYTKKLDNYLKHLQETKAHNIESLHNYQTEFLENLEPTLFSSTNSD